MKLNQKNKCKSNNRPILLHVGLPKSMSTTLQNLIFPKIFNVQHDCYDKNAIKRFDLNTYLRKDLSKIRVLSNENYIFNFRIEKINQNKNLESNLSDIIKFNKSHPVIILFVLNHPFKLIKSGYLNIFSKNSFFSGKKTLSFDEYQNLFEHEFFNFSKIFKKLVNSSIPFLVINLNDQNFNFKKTILTLSKILNDNKVSDNKFDKNFFEKTIYNISPKTYVSYFFLRLEKTFRKIIFFLIKIINKLFPFSKIEYNKQIIRDMISLYLNKLSICKINLKFSKFNSEELNKKHLNNLSYLQTFKHKDSIFRFKI